MDTNFLKKLKPLVERFAQKWGIEIDEATDIVTHYFVFLKKSLLDSRIPRVKTPIGTFSLTLAQRSSIRNRNTTLYERGTISKEIYDLRMSFLDQIEERIIKENSRKERPKNWGLSRKSEMDELLSKIENYEKTADRRRAAEQARIAKIKKRREKRENSEEAPTIHGSNDNPKE